MLPYSPGLTIRALTDDDGDAAGELVNRMLARTLYSAPMDETAIREQLFGAAPPTLYPVRWQKRNLLGAWRAGNLVGLLDAATGMDRDSLILPDYQPLGILRFLVLPDQPELVEDVMQLLLDAAERFWRSAGVGHVKAYHISTGYPQFQAGAGLLPGDWSDQVRLLTSQEFRFEDRYYCLARPLDQLFEETVPHTSISLAFRGKTEDRQYQIFFRRTELIGEARLLRRHTGPDSDPQRIAYLAHWEIDARWRNQKIGRWLLRRLINDATLLGCQEIVVHLHPQQSAAMNLLNQHGFLELNYRGYSLEKNLQE